MGATAHNIVSMVPRQRAAVLAAAREHFARRGFLETSLHDIARGAGLSLERVLTHFKDKRELFERVVDQVWAEALADLEAAVWEAGPPEERVRTFITHRQGMAERMIRALRVTPEALVDLVPRLEPLLAGPRARELALLEAILEDGTVSGAFPLRDTRAAARALAASLQGIECATVRFCLTPRRPR
ncbi:TetR/AcrR family transcriptional regulator [Myxococcus sp. K15C18031901]|uniref:TetR/AcrR family transcriptional regulator n=1 Tax=Myxococcus dinghuensis TaxID=2906761 RepID=UPI0020A81644|nr:TetR/AcrR family transcriptional regulator [Myxococcus dinghuensis]MCP3098251.1 TetR/AcrR family transcriptional regulator [Myxococcus dinghuensis]